MSESKNPINLSEKVGIENGESKHLSVSMVVWTEKKYYAVMPRNIFELEMPEESSEEGIEGAGNSEITGEEWVEYMRENAGTMRKKLQSMYKQLRFKADGNFERLEVTVPPEMKYVCDMTVVKEYVESSPAEESVVTLSNSQPTEIEARLQ